MLHRNKILQVKTVDHESDEDKKEDHRKSVIDVLELNVPVKTTNLRTTQTMYTTEDVTVMLNF